MKQEITDFLVNTLGFFNFIGAMYNSSNLTLLMVLSIFQYLPTLICLSLTTHDEAIAICLNI